MPTRLTVVLLVTAIVTAACSGTAETGATTTTTAPVTTTSSTTTTAPPLPNPTTTDTAAAEFAAVVAGIGDEFYPELGNPGYDVAHYTLDLAFDPDTLRLAGVVTIDARATAPLETLNLDLEGFDVDGVRVGDAETRFARTGEEITIALPAPLDPGTDFVVEIAYSGTTAPVASRAIGFPIGWINSESGQHYVVAEPDGAHSWFPANDHPLDKATFTFMITVPDGVTAAANGVLTETITDLGQETWVWELDSPMATYLATVVIGQFDIVADEPGTARGGVPLRNVLPRGSTIADWPGLERQGEMMAFLSDLFGPYPFDRYGIAIVDGFGAALENQTLSLFDSAIAASGFFEDVLIHELAHQWFGNSVSPAQWRDIWLNEGFASYAEWLWIERQVGSAEVEVAIAEERDFWAAQPDLLPPGTPSPTDLFAGTVYRVGALTLHALRLTVGDADFFDILRAYAARFQNGNAATSDFIALAEEVSGEDLGPLFDDWLYTPGVPAFPAP